MFDFLKKKNKNSMNRSELSRIDGKSILYAIEKTNDGELVLGKNGGVAICEDEILVMCEAHEIFRSKIKTSSIAELMSGNGVCITGYDLNENRERKVIAYYNKFR